MIDININAIISQALAAAVSTHITTLQQEYANKMAEMAQQIAALDTHLAEAIDRIAALENQALVVSDAVDKRLLALENNPAQGVDTTLEETLQRLDNQEWFWNKLRNFTDTAVEQAIENHTDCWDHNDFVTEDKLDDYVTKDSFRDEIEDVLNNATIRIRF